MNLFCQVWCEIALARWDPFIDMLDPFSVAIEVFSFSLTVAYIFNIYMPSLCFSACVLYLARYMSRR
jgi:hypothetical protein